MTSKKQAASPSSMSLNDTLSSEGIHSSALPNKTRIILIAAYAVVIAALISFIAKFLVLFINIITNLSFYGTFSFHEGSPCVANLGIWVIVVPAFGGLIVGSFALYGSTQI